MAPSAGARLRHAFRCPGSGSDAQPDAVDEQGARPRPRRDGPLTAAQSKRRSSRASAPKMPRATTASAVSSSR